MKPSIRRASPPRRYVLGIDFGTLSARALLVNATNGAEIATVVHPYEHGVIEEVLPRQRTRLPPRTALQEPADYLAALENMVPRLLRRARAKPAEVLGIGIDFTSCTILPTTADGSPLCWQKAWRSNPHAWVKLWKHHSAQPEADHINALGQQRQEFFLRAYGGRYSSEWFFSKILETLRHAPEVYTAADRFLEAGDWVVWQLCGQERRCLSAAGFKAMWVYGTGNPDHPVEGYPGRDFFAALHPGMREVVRDKVAAPLIPLGSRAGGLTPRMARRLGLLPGTPVAAANIDAHVAVPACGVTAPGKLVMIAGTSTCHLLLSQTRSEVEGACGVVKDGVVPGFWGYEAGQAGVGDLFAWYLEQGVPPALHQQARRAGLSTFQLLEKQAAKLAPGESGLLALDWWNGCRSVLMDADLNGLLVGLTLATQPPEIYRALIEATAFGTRRIIEAFTQAGVAIEELHACGGLAQKSALWLQIYADVTGRPIRLAASEQTCALGSALHAAVAAELFPDIASAAAALVRPSPVSCLPQARHRETYDQLYAQYLRLHDAFGRDPESPMKVLQRLRRSVLQSTVPS